MVLILILVKYLCNSLVTQQNVAETNMFVPDQITQYILQMKREMMMHATVLNCFTLLSEVKSVNGLAICNDICDGNSQHREIILAFLLFSAVVLT